MTDHEEKPVTIIDAIRNQKLFGSLFPDLTS